jgi:hypothetical protein
MWPSFVPRSVQPDIREIRCNLDRRLKSAQLIHAAGGVIASQNFVHRRHIPALVAKLEHVVMGRRKSAQECAQPLDIYFPVRRKLKQNRPPPPFELLHGLHEPLDRVRRVFQRAVMRDVAVGFYRKAEGTGRWPALAGERLAPREVTAAAIDLNRVQVLRIPPEHLRSRQIAGIKRPPPVLVFSTGRANADQRATVDEDSLAMSCRSRVGTSSPATSRPRSRGRIRGTSACGRRPPAAPEAADTVPMPAVSARFI